MIPFDPAAYQLLQDGAAVLSEIEATGMRVDTDYLRKAIRRTERKIAGMEEALAGSDVTREWRKRFGAKIKLGSLEQLGEVLFNVMGLPAPERKTATGRHKMDEESLTSVDHPYVRDYLRIKTLQRALSTNLRGLLPEIVDGYIHPFFHLHLVRTYRSSSSNPNFQNIPVRDEEIRDLVRAAFVPRPGRRLIEMDFSGIEVRIASCYNRDPKLIEYILDPTKDMHRDMAMECYRLPQAEVTKPVRAAAKGSFVFAQFYGDWYIDCAPRLWDLITKEKLATKSGVPLLEHLRSKGITHLGALDPRLEPTNGSFEKHIKEVERAFWNVRFRVYNQWKKDWFAAYQRAGYYKTLTGFICQTPMKRNDCINYGIQGSAFHCLLWSLIQLVKVELKKRRMRSLVVGQIHDSVLADVPPGEQDDYIALVRQIIEKDLREHWPWIIVPMAVEAEGTETDGSWATKKPVDGPSRDDSDTGLVPSGVREDRRKMRELKHG